MILQMKCLKVENYKIMKGSNAFKSTIEEYLKSRASTDALFAKTFQKENKNIDDCITFIMNTVKSSGENGFADDEIFNMAVHYYDEDDIKVGAKIKGNVVVNHKVELTPEEIEEEKVKARKSVFDEQRAKMTKKPAKKKKVAAPVKSLIPDKKVESKKTSTPTLF